MQKKKSNCLRSNPTLWETLLSGMLAKLAQLTQNQDKRQEAIEKHVTCGHRCSGPSQTGARTGFTKCRCSTETNILISSGPATVITLACCYVALVQTEKKTEVLHTEIKVQPPSHNADFFFFLISNAKQSFQGCWVKQKSNPQASLVIIFKQAICCERNVTCL